jgi:threonine synthase
MGIVNGTTNFILTRMDEQGSGFADALDEATALGYAEADPTADVEGFDAAAKGAILAGLAFHTRVVAADVHREGITEVTAADVASAKAIGCVVKLLAIAEKDGGAVSVRVHPAMIPLTHPLASVREAYNAVFVEAASAGRLMFYGPGAGGAPTASAVLGDLVAVARNAVSGARGAGDSSYADLRVRPMGEVVTRYHVSLDVADKAGVLAAVAQVFATHDVSLRTVRQEGHGDDASLVVVTHTATDAALQAVVDDLRRLDSVRAVASVMRVEGRAAVTAPVLARAGWRGLIEEYRDRLPVTATTPVVTLQEGATPLVPAEHLSELVGATVRLKVEGANPTGSFKDRGMTMAISKAVEAGSKAVICASTGNTSASAAAYAAKGGLTCAVLVPEGKIALGKLAQALVHGARLLQVQGNFDDCLDLCRELSEEYPVTLVNSVNPDRIEGQKTAAFEICDVLGDAPELHFLPVGNAGNITAYWKGYAEYAADGVTDPAPRMMGFQAAGAAPIVSGSGWSRRRRSRPPSGSATRRRGSRRWTRVTSPAGRSTPSPTGRSCRRTSCSPSARACSWSRPRRPASPGCCRCTRRAGCRRAPTSSAPSPATGSRTPTGPSPVRPSRSPSPRPPTAAAAALGLA